MRPTAGLIFRACALGAADAPVAGNERVPEWANTSDGVGDRRPIEAADVTAVGFRNGGLLME